MKNLPVNFSPYEILGSLDPSITQAVLIFIAVFFTAILLGLSRRYLASSTLQGVWAGFVVGVITLLAIEGVIFWGAKSFLESEHADVLPQNVRSALADSQNRITQVLGIETERDMPTAQTVVSDYNLLTTLDAELAQNSICKVEEEE